MNKRHEIEDKINAHAWKDPKFKEKLRTDPSKTLKEFGLNVPSGAKIHIHEEDANTWHLVLQKSPNNVKDLSEEELMRSAGDCNPQCG